MARPPATLADVDLTTLRTRMAETVERAKANDPATLRQEIARPYYKAELARVQKAAPARPTPVPGTREIPVPRAPEVKRLEAFLGKAERLLAQRGQALDDLRAVLVSAVADTTFREALQAASTTLQTVQRTVAAARGPEPPIPGPRPPLASAELQGTAMPAPAARAVVSTNGARRAGGSSGDRRMLAVLAQFFPRRLTSVELGVWSLIHPGGGSSTPTLRSCARARRAAWGQLLRCGRRTRGCRCRPLPLGGNRLPQESNPRYTVPQCLT